MSDAEESAAQRQARLRREKREAKIKSGGQDRLDRITRVSGRTPESIRQNASPVATPPRTASPAVQPAVPPSSENVDPEQVRQQEEFIRAMLRSQTTQPQPQESGQDVEDPMLKMLSSIMGNMSDDPNAPNGGLPSLNPDDIAKATGLPSFVTNMMMGGQGASTTPADMKNASWWKMVHIIFAAVVGVYTMLTVDRLGNTFGDSPPAPATAQNPFVIFVMMELLLHGIKPFISTGSTKTGPALWLQTAKDIGRDGAVVVFLMGAYNWWHDLA